MKKIFIIVCCLFVISGCSKEISEEQREYNRLVDNLVNSHENSSDIPFDITLETEVLVDERVERACLYILKHKISKIALIGKKEDYCDDISTSQDVIFFEKNKQNIDKFAKVLFELRKEKGLTLTEAKKLLLKDTYFVAMLAYLKLIKGAVMGAKYTTAEVLKPALQIVKTKDGKSKVFGAMLLLKEDDIKLFADVSLNEDPDAESLKEFAISSADFLSKLKIKPIVGMLSYSTKGSAKSNFTEKVATATNMAKLDRPSLLIDGEMQLDCALIKEVASVKAKNSLVAGHANILIFPDLNAGNIGYKLIERFGKLQAIGVIMQGFKKPINDLSRGCKINDIVVMTAITCLQAVK